MSFYIITEFKFINQGPCNLTKIDSVAMQDFYHCALLHPSVFIIFTGRKLCHMKQDKCIHVNSSVALRINNFER